MYQLLTSARYYNIYIYKLCTLFLILDFFIFIQPLFLFIYKHQHNFTLPCKIVFFFYLQNDIQNIFSLFYNSTKLHQINNIQHHHTQTMDL